MMGSLKRRLDNHRRRHPGRAIDEAGAGDQRIGEEIPLDLYKAVSEVLIFILRMSGRLR